MAWAVGSQVLLVEDDPVLQRAIRRAAAGVADIAVTGTGSEGLAWLETRPLPSVVLLDFMLPDLDGIGVLRALRARPLLRHLPVVLFSSLHDPRRREEALEAGATEWVDKPDDPATLRHVVRTLCAKYAPSAAAGL